MQILGMLPASAVPKHMENIRQSSALTIQSAWRGFLVRKEFEECKSEKVKSRSAIILQRAVCNVVNYVFSV